MSVLDFSSLLEYLPEDLKDVVPFPHHRIPQQQQPAPTFEGFASLETPVYIPDYGKGMQDFPASPMPPPTPLMFDPPEYVFDREPPNYATAKVYSPPPPPPPQSPPPAASSLHRQQKQSPRPSPPMFSEQQQQQQQKRQQHLRPTTPPLPPPPLPKHSSSSSTTTTTKRQQRPLVSPKAPSQVFGLGTKTLKQKIKIPSAVVVLPDKMEKKPQQQQQQREQKTPYIPKIPTYLKSFKIPKRMPNKMMKPSTSNKISKLIVDSFGEEDVLILHPDPKDFEYVLGRVPLSYQKLFENSKN